MLNRNPLWDEIETMWDEMDRTLTSLRFTPTTAGPEHASGGYPSIRLHEAPDALYVEAMIPGVDLDTLELSVVRRTLTLAGEKKSPYADTDAEPKVFHRRERLGGRFERRLGLPMKVDTDRVSAEYADGMLRVTLPGLGQDTPRQISIQAVWPFEINLFKKGDQT